MVVSLWGRVGFRVEIKLWRLLAHLGLELNGAELIDAELVDDVNWKFADREFPVDHGSGVVVWVGGHLCLLAW